MRLEGEVSIDTAIENVWQVFMDPAMLCHVTPGCEEVRRIDATHYEGRMAVKVQFLTIRATWQGALIEAREPEYLMADIAGEATKLAGAFQARLAIALSAEGAATRARYTCDISMLGRLGNLGEPIVRSTSQKLVRRVAESIAGLFEPSG